MRSTDVIPGGAAIRATLVAKIVLQGRTSARSSVQAASPSAS